MRLDFLSLDIAPPPPSNIFIKWQLVSFQRRPQSDWHKTTMDTEIVQNTRTGVKAGDPSEAVRADAIGGPPYCFRLKNDHPDGAHGAIAKYKPWWADIKRTWNPEIEAHRKSFKRWTQEHSSSSDKTATHVAMNSGRLCIPLGSEEAAFLDAYAKCLLAGHRMYFVEQLTYSWTPPCFRLFMDLDFKQLQGITERGIEAASVVCAKTVRRFFSVDSTTIVCSTTYKDTSTVDTKGNKVKLIKTGVHLYWPTHYVTPLQCLHIRESIIADLTEVFGSRSEPEMNLWDDVVDKSVYGDAHGGRGSGLRMIGSCKTDKCSTCNGRGTLKSDGTKCTVCLGDRRVDDMDNAGRPGRPYMMLCVLDASAQRSIELEDLYKSDLKQLVLDTKLRTSLTESTLDNGFDLPPGAPLFLATTRKRAGAPLPRGERHMDPTDPLHLELQSCVRQSFGTLYAHAVVKRVSKGAKQYTVNVTGENCRYCQNIGREHASNNIYFVVTRDGIVQRCYDTGTLTEEMKHGLCSAYRSGTMALSPHTANVLWPQAAETISAFTSDANTTSFAMRALLNAGEYLSTHLFGTSWTATLGLLKSKAKGLKDFMPLDPRDLGTRGIEAYRDLGLSWADALCGEAPTAEEDSDDEPKKRSIADLEKALLDAFDTIVLLAASVSEPDVFEDNVYMDDYCRPSETREAGLVLVC